MFKVRIPRPFYLFLSFALLVGPLPLTAIAQDINSSLSEWEQSGAENKSGVAHVYLGQELSDIAEVIARVGQLDDDQYSPLNELTHYIKEGFLFVEQDEIIQVLEYAQDVVQKKYTTLDQDYAQNLSYAIETFIEQIADGALTIDSTTITRAPCSRTLVVNEKMNVLCKSVFYKHMKTKQGIHILGKLKVGKRAKFKKDVKINGTLSVTDLVVTDCIDNLCVNNLSVVDASVSGTLSVQDAYIVNGTIDNLTVSATVLDSIINNLTVLLTLSANDAVIDDATITNLSANNAVLQNLEVTNCIPNLCVNNLSVVEATVSGTLSANDEVINNFLRFNDMTGGEYVGLQAPAVVPTSYTLSLPSTAPTANQVLHANAITPTDLEWFTTGGSVPPAASKIIYVTKFGNDTTGDGSFDNPFLTFSKAITIANGLASLANPIAIVIDPGIYVENNSAGALAITAPGISVIGTSASGTVIVPNTPSNDLLLVTNTVRISNIVFQSPAQLATGISLTAGNLTVLSNVRFVNFLIGVNCAGGALQSYGFNLCLFIQNGTAINVNNTAVECNSCFISGASSIAGPAANIGISATGSSTRFVSSGGVIGLCVTGYNVTGNAVATISGVSFRSNTFDVVQTGASHLTLSACTTEMTNSPADVDVQISGAGTTADIIGCEFNGNSSIGVPQSTGIIISNNATVNISGGTMRNYTTGIQIGNPGDTSSTKLDASSFIINGCINDIIQNGSATLAFNASTASSSKISVNDPTNVELAFFDLDDNGALTIGSTADMDTSLIQAAISPLNHPGIDYRSSLYTAQAIGAENLFGSGTPSALYALGSDHIGVLSITTDRTKVAALRLASDEGLPIGGTSALRGWDINKTATAAELAFRYQNSDIVGQIAVPQHTVMQLDGLNNQLQLPAAGTQIIFAGDTNLYRSSANVLKTDDNFIVDTLTPDRVVVTNFITNQLESSFVTGTELSYLSGVTSPIQTQLDGKVAKTGDIMTGTLELPAGTTALPSLVFTGSTTTGLSAPVANSLSFSTNAAERMKISSTGTITVDAFGTAGVVHNNASGDLSSSLIVDADITNATISNAKLATISNLDIPGNIVVRDGFGNFETNMITLDGTVTNPTDAVTKAYVDAAISLGLVAKTPALVVSTTDIGSPTGLIVIDGVALAANDRVLLTGQTNPIENGLWLAQVGAWTRPADFANGTAAGQAYVLILSGAIYTGSSWLCNTPMAIIGTDPIMFALFTLPDVTTGANVGAGTGLVFKNKTGITLNFRSLLADPHTVITTNANDITIGTDATNLNTPSTIVARDALGNFFAGTITASLNGAASDNVLKIGDTMTGALQLPAGTVLAPSLNFTGSTTTGLSAPVANSLSFSTNALERMNISSTGVVAINALTPAGVVHNDASGNLSTSLIVNSDVDPAAAIVDTKLATISTAGKVANSATTATSANTPNTIVLRDGAGNFNAGTIIASLMGAASDNVLKAGDTMTGTLQLPAGTTALPSLVFTGSATTGLSASAGDLSFSTNALERMKISSGGTISIDAFTMAGVVHNDASGDLSSSLIVDADVDPAAGIIDTKLATISTPGKVANSATSATSADVSNAIVSRDSSGNFTTNMITIDGTTTNPTDVATKAYVDSQIGGTGTNLNMPNTLVKRDGTGSFAAQVVSVVDSVASGTLTVLPFAVAGVVHNNASGLLSSSLIVNADITNGTIGNAKLATASSADLPGYIVVRDGSGNFSTNMITIDGVVTNPTDVATKAYVDASSSSITGANVGVGTGLIFRDKTGSTLNFKSLLQGSHIVITNNANDITIATDGTSANTASTLVARDALGNFSAGAISVTDEVISTSLTITPFGTAGVVHNNAAGLLSSSLIVNADITNGTISNAKLATASSADLPGYIVVRDGSGNFSTNMITIDGTTTNPTDVATKAYVDGQISTTGTNLNTPNTLVRRDGTGSFAAQVVSVVDAVASGNLILSTEPSISTAGNIFKGSNRFIHDFGTNNTFVGINSGNFTMTGTDNIGVGRNALQNNTAGNFNVGIGNNALAANTIGGNNTGVGNNALMLNATGVNNTAVGAFALNLNTTGINNTALGSNVLGNNSIGNDNTAAGNSALGSNTTGNANTAFGSFALTLNTTGTNNTAIGAFALDANTIGTDNTALGINSLGANTTGIDNTAIGSTALAANTIGTFNTAVGRNSLAANTVGVNNTAVGRNTLAVSTTGNDNTAVGFNALAANATGTSNNTAVGSNALAANITGGSNTAVGRSALAANTIAENNTAVGFNALTANTTGTPNTAVGSSSLAANTTGANNTAVGRSSLAANTVGTNNTALGHNTLLVSTTGTDNTAVGFNALAANATGTSNNTAVGSSALAANTTGTFNTAVGRSALAGNTVGINNTAVGRNALAVSTTGTDNTAVGFNALAVNATGTSNNTAVGSSALAANTTGTFNTAVGRSALAGNTVGINNTAVGRNALAVSTTGTDNTAIGFNALAANTTGTSNNTAVGSSALAANTTGTRNTAVGRSALAVSTISTDNTAVGFNALAVNATGTSNNTAVGSSALAANTTGTSNTAVGRSALTVNTTGINNTAVGQSSLAANTIGTQNTAVGNTSLALNTTGVNNTAVGNNALGVNTVGISNTAVGQGALQANTTGTQNTAVGQAALAANTIASNNTAVGQAALAVNTTGANNTSVGSASLLANTIGAQNTAVGVSALGTNTTGNNNTAVGYQALLVNIVDDNTAVGSNTLVSNTTGIQNTAIGRGALQNNITGFSNNALGFNALSANISGANNTAIGAEALLFNTAGANVAVGTSSLRVNTTGASNTAVGFQSLINVTTGSNNVALGDGAGGVLTTGSNNIYIGRLVNAVANNESNVTRIGNISGVNVGASPAVLVTATGQLGVNTSTQKVKHDIEDMNDGSAAIYQMRPVIFVYNGDETETKQYGLIAEEVDEVFPALVARDKNGEVQTVLYHVLPVLLLNEVQKQQKTIEQLTITTENMNVAINSLQEQMQQFITSRNPLEHCA